MTRHAIAASVAREHLFPAHRGVFFLDADPSQLSRWTAAVARCGPDPLLSDGPAAAAWTLIGRWHGPPHVTVPRGGTRSPKGIVIHWTIRPDEGSVRDGIPVTSLYRTLDDFARTADPKAVKAALRRAEYHHAVDLSAVAAAATSARLKTVLRPYIAGQGKTDSELEADFYELIATRTPLPRPELQRDVPGGRADFVWAERRLIVEVDGYDAHKGRIAYRDDRARDRRQRRADWLPLRYTWEDVALTPAEVAEDVVSAWSSRSTLSMTKS
ncbi:MAG: DUF559 domain-containing protein [Solirubrobacteraceae bacterium]